MTRALSIVPSGIVVVVLAIFVSLPLYSMIVTAFKTDKEIYDDFTYIPRQPTLIQFQRVIVNDRFVINIRNTAAMRSRQKKYPSTMI